MGIDFGAIINEVNNLAPVKFVREVLSLADPTKRGTFKNRQKLQQELAKQGVNFQAHTTKPTENIDQITKALSNEGLGHHSRLAKLESAYKKLEEMIDSGKYRTVGDAVKDLKSTLRVKEEQDKVKKFKNDYRSKSFTEVTKGIISGTDTRSVYDLDNAHTDQINQMSASIDPSNSALGTVADYVAEEALLKLLEKQKKDKALDNVKAVIFANINKERKAVEQRSLQIASELIEITSE